MTNIKSQTILNEPNLKIQRKSVWSFEIDDVVYLGFGNWDLGFQILEW